MMVGGKVMFGHAAPAAALIDQSVFDCLLDVIGAEALAEVLDSCRRQFRESGWMVAAAIDGEDVRALHAISHDLKSSALNVGLTDLGSLAREIETACRDGRSDDALRLASGLPDRLEQACATLQSLHFLN